MHTENKEVFASRGIRNTKQRNLILDILKHAQLPLTAEDIYAQLREESDSISLSTVYRILDVFVGKELALKTHISADTKAMFELNRMEHKHHLICVHCKTMVAISYCPLGAYEQELEQKTGYDILGHKLQMYGYCPDCRSIAQGK